MISKEELTYCRNMLRARRTSLKIQCAPRMDVCAERTKSYADEIGKIDSILVKIKTALDEGRAKKDNPELPVEFIKTLLSSKETDRSLAEPFTFDKTDDE